MKPPKEQPKEKEVEKEKGSMLEVMKLDLKDLSIKELIALTVKERE